MTHPAFTARFKADLVRPGLRVPLTVDATLFAEAVTLIVLEPKQSDLLTRICDSRLLSAEELGRAGALADMEQKPVKSIRKGRGKA